MSAIQPKWWRSSTLGEIDRHCLAVIHPDFADMTDRLIFGPGTVAHDVYSRVQIATNKAGNELDHLDAEEIALGAIKKGAGSGREFEQIPEPPLRPQAYLDGKSLALRWLAERPAQPGRETEFGITIDRWGAIVAKDSPERWVRGILDLLWIDEDRIMVIPDIKTDWPSEANALHTAQRKIQMMLGFAWAADNGIALAGIRPEIWNMRRNKIYPREEERDQYTLDFESLGVLDSWRTDLLAITDGYDEAVTSASSAEDLASPGFGCLAGEGGCPALAMCKAGQAWVAKRLGEELPPPPADGEPQPPVSHAALSAAAVQQPVLWAESARLRAVLEPAAEALGVIEAGGMECGFEERPGFEPRLDAVLELWREYRGSQIANPIACLCEGKDPECSMCSGVGASIDWELELNRQRALLITFLSAIRPIGSDLFTKKILPKLWPLVGVPKEERASNKLTRELISQRLLEPISRRRWFCRKMPGPPEPGSTVVEKLEQSITQTKERNRFSAPSGDTQ